MSILKNTNTQLREEIANYAKSLPQYVIDKKMSVLRQIENLGNDQILLRNIKNNKAVIMTSQEVIERNLLYVNSEINNKFSAKEYIRSRYTEAFKITQIGHNVIKFANQDTNDLTCLFICINKLFDGININFGLHKIHCEFNTDGDIVTNAIISIGDGNIENIFNLFHTDVEHAWDDFDFDAYLEPFLVNSLYHIKMITGSDFVELRTREFVGRYTSQLFCKKNDAIELIINILDKRFNNPYAYTK
jgi:hypothetical protein